MKTSNIVLFGLCGSLLVTAGALLTTWMTGGAWADAAGWVEAFATTAALGAAVAAALLVGRTVQIELNREGARLDAERRSQAERVAAWGIASQRIRSGDGAILRVETHIRNASDLPIYNAFVRLKATFVLAGEAHETTFERMFPLIPPSGGEIAAPSVQDITLGLSKAFLNLNAPAQVEEWNDSFAVIETTLQFRDTANQIWQRRANGRLLGPNPVE